MIYTSPIESPAFRDAFGRFRVSEPQSIFDSQFTYDLQPLLFDQVTVGTGSIAYNSTDKTAQLSVSTTSDEAIMQSYEYFRYQPGKSQLVFVTFNFNGGVARTQKFAGYSDGVNGIEVFLDQTTPKIRLLSDTNNGDQEITQASWNLDTMDGSGDSGVTIDFNKVQILVIDFQALYVGKVRVGFDTSSGVVYAHEFDHVNTASYPYIQSANLPIRVGIKATDVASSTVDFICCSVVSEGGQEENYGYIFTSEGTVTAGNGADTHILSIQPKTTFGGITNRVKLEILFLNLLVTGNNPVLYKLCLGQTLTSTSTDDVNATYSAVETITGTLDGTPDIILTEGYVPATNQVAGSISAETKIRIPITLDASGAQRDLGRITVLVQGIGSTSDTRCSLTWKEIR